MKIFRQPSVHFPKLGSSTDTCLYLLVIDVGSSKMQIAISFHHIFPHPFLGPEHGRDVAENMILLTNIHPALYVKLSLVTFNNTFIKGGKEDDFLHDGVCGTHMFVNRIRYTLRPCLLYKRKQEANPNPYKQQTFQPQFLLIESGQIYGRICVMQKHVP